MNNMSDTPRKIVTRFAPSPTGFMHVGNVRSALYAWLWTRKNNGTFILRIEDTDKEREVAGSIDHILESLRWLGIDWDSGPYLQSERLELYRQYAQKLIDKGLAYPDPYTTEEMEVFRKKAEEEKRAFLFREHRPETIEVWDGTKPLRFRVPEIKSYSWHDEVFGDLSAGPEALDDFVIIKSDGYPTYNFAHIVDDIEMGVTLVMRGQEYISSTPKFLSVYEALGVTPPLYACLPHIMADGGKKKLGKRDGAKDILEYRTEGYLPNALINFLAFLGWNPGDDREIFTRNELIEAFAINRIGHSGAQLNTDKLDWINKEHIKKLSPKEQVDWVSTFMPEAVKSLPGFSELFIQKVTPVIVERIEKFSDITTLAEAGEFEYYFTTPTSYDTEALIWKSLRGTEEGRMKTASYLTQIHDVLSTVTDWSQQLVHEAVWPLTETLGRGEILWPLRYALSNRDKSPDPFILLSILGRDESLKRIEYVISLLQ